MKLEKTAPEHDLQHCHRPEHDLQHCHRKYRNITTKEAGNKFLQEF